MKKALLALLILGVGALVVWRVAIHTAGHAKAGDTQSDSPKAVVNLPDYLTHQSTLDGQLTTAKQLASRWNSDAKLVSVAVNFVNELSLEKMDYEYFVFRSAQVSDKLAIVDTSQKPARFSVVEAISMPSVENTVEIPQSFWQVNFINAINLVENVGGNEFRTANGNGYKVSAILGQKRGDVLAWYVTYANQDDTEEEKWVVNASSGLVEATS
jgi:hypothetical protein